MALPLDGAGSTAGGLESCAAETGPVKRNAIALNASRRLASDLQAPLGQNAATPLKTVLRIGTLLSLGSESGEQYSKVAPTLTQPSPASEPHTLSTPRAPRRSIEHLGLRRERIPEGFDWRWEKTPAASWPLSWPTEVPWRLSG